MAYPADYTGTGKAPVPCIRPAIWPSRPVFRTVADAQLAVMYANFMEPV